MLNSRINDYVEEVLMPYFGNLICFVKECEILIEKDNFSGLKSYESKKMLLNSIILFDIKQQWSRFVKLIIIFFIYLV